MFSVIVMSHGKMTLGLKDTLMMVSGEKENVYFIPFNPSDSTEEYEKKVRVVFHSIPNNHQVLMLCDLYGGTPANIASKLCLENNDRIAVVVGVNFPILLSVTINQDLDLFDSIDNIIEEGQQSIMRVANITLAKNEDDE